MPDKTTRHSPTVFGWWSAQSSVTTYEMENEFNMVSDDQNYARTKNNVPGWGAGHGSTVPGYNINNYLPGAAIVRRVRFYTEAMNASGTSDFRHRIYIGDSNGDGSEWITSEVTTSGEIGSSWTVKDVVITSLNRSHFNNGLFFGIHMHTKGIAVRQQRVRYHFMDVTWYVPATSISLNKTELSLVVGNTEQLLPTALPVDTTDSLTWTSTNPSVATVAGAGLVTALNSGTTVIRVTSESGKSAECTVTVMRTYTLQTSVTPSGTGSVSPSSGVFTEGTTQQLQISPVQGHIITQILVNGEAQPITDRHGQQITIVFTQDTSIAITFECLRPLVTQTHTRERISDKAGYEKSVVTYSADMDYIECEIRRTASGAPRGRGIGELLYSDTTPTAAGAERVFEAYYYHLETDGDYVVSVYVKSSDHIWSN